MCVCVHVYAHSPEPLKTKTCPFAMSPPKSVVEYILSIHRWRSRVLSAVCVWSLLAFWTEQRNGGGSSFGPRYLFSVLSQLMLPLRVRHTQTQAFNCNGRGGGQSHRVRRVSVYAEWSASNWVLWCTKLVERCTHFLGAHKCVCACVPERPETEATHTHTEHTPTENPRMCA